MNIAVLSHYSFPSGMSGTNRIASLAKGLVERGHKVKIFCIMPSEKPNGIINTETEGVFEGIEFQYTAGTVVWPDGKIKKLMVFAKGYVCSVPKVHDYYKKGCDCILSVTEMMCINVLFFFFTRLFRLPFVSTMDEYPCVVREPMRYNALHRFLYLKGNFKLFDGMIIMTKRLMEYYGSFARINAPMIHVPMTVDTTRFDSFSCRYVDKSDEQFIGYCGAFDSVNNKDGIDILIKAFKKISDEFPSMKLYIIGGAIDRDKRAVTQLEKLTVDLGLGGRVVFLGKIHRDKIPELLSRATVLALARPNSIQAESGFPTKLGEYLMTGRPVVVTAVGEILNYLTDRETAFIAKPDSVDSFAEKLEEVLSDLNHAKKVGHAGREVALHHFNYKVQASRIEKYLLELCR